VIEEAFGEDAEKILNASTQGAPATPRGAKAPPAASDKSES